jgi:hypothetical protein
MPERRADVSKGRYTDRTIGSEPVKREPVKKEDPKTEAVRETLKGNPYGKKYGPGSGAKW